jgi:putative ABC transport system permease protein
MSPEGATMTGGPPAHVIYRVISPGFFETLRVPLIRGRLFDERDREDGPLVTIVNEKAAQDFWPDQDPIGKRLKFGWMDSNSPWMQVVGVTSDLKQVALNEPSRDEVYCPHLQSRVSWEWPRFLIVRTSGEPLAVQAALRQMAARIDPQEPLNHVMRMSDVVERETSQNEMHTLLLGGLALLALTMACVGIYGVMAYLVSQRNNEIGIRLALGANPGSILTLVLGQGMKLVLIGVAVGLAAACMLTRLIRTLLFGVNPFDPLTFVAVACLLTTVALAACYFPAHRATQIDPMIALRNE